MRPPVARAVSAPGGEVPTRTTASIAKVSPGMTVVN
jgi:hypothetical protein